MRFVHKTVLTLPLLVGAPLAMFDVQALTPQERSALQPGAGQLENLRAGAATPRAALTLDEHASLRQAEQRTSELGALRAGSLDMTDREMMWLVLGVLVVVLIIVA